MDMQLQLKSLHKKLEYLINQEIDFHMEAVINGLDENSVLYKIRKFVQSNKTNESTLKHIGRSLLSKISGLFSKLKKKITGGKHLESDYEEDQKNLERIEKIADKIQSRLKKSLENRFVDNSIKIIIALLIILPIVFLIGIHAYYFYMNKQIWAFEGVNSVINGFQSITKNIANIIDSLSNVKDLTSLIKAIIKVILSPIKIAKDFFEEMFKYQEDNHLISITAEYTTVFVMCASGIVVGLGLLGLGVAKYA